MTWIFAGGGAWGTANVLSQPPASEVDSGNTLTAPAFSIVYTEPNLKLEGLTLGSGSGCCVASLNDGTYYPLVAQHSQCSER